MISVWLGDRSGWTGVRLAELDRSSFVDRSAGSWIGALVRGSEWIGALVCGSELVLSGSWIGVDRSAVRGSELFGSLIGVDRSPGFWIGARSLWFVDQSGSERCAWVGALWFVDRSGSELWFVDRSSFSLVRGSERCAWIGAIWFVDRSGSELWFLDRSLFSLVRGSERCAWIGALWFVDRSGSELWFVDRSSFSLSLCVAVRGSDLSGLWIGVDRRYEMWIGARSLFLSALLCMDRSSLCCCVCVCFVFLFSLSLCVAVRGE